MAVPTMTPTDTLSMAVKPAMPWVMPETRLSSASRLRSAGSHPLFPSLMGKLSWKSSPYNLGVAVRWERLAPNTAVPQRAITASTDPRRALRTGTGLRRSCSPARG